MINSNHYFMFSIGSQICLGLGVFLTGGITSASLLDGNLIGMIIGPSGAVVLLLIIGQHLYKRNQKLEERNERLIEDREKRYKDEIAELKKREKKQR